MISARMSRRVKVLLVSGATVAVAVLSAGCGTEKISVPKSSPDYAGAILFSQRCAGCHTLAAAATHGSASNIKTRLITNGPNLNTRCERPAIRVLYAIENGGFSGATMPQNIVVGPQARQVAEFVAQYAGRTSGTPVGQQPCSSRPLGSIPAPSATPAATTTTTTATPAAPKKTKAKKKTATAKKKTAPAKTKAPAKTTPKAPAPTGPKIATATLPGLGAVLVNAEGHTLYIFVPDNDKKVTCVGGCAAIWPPASVPSGQTATATGPVKQALLGSDPNPAGGLVITYAGWPLYTYIADGTSGSATGQGINLNGGLWYVISPTGKVIKAKPHG
jgi:predicted lipoprotein with Yx(FWY)xxD motif